MFVKQKNMRVQNCIHDIKILKNPNKHPQNL